MIRRKTAGGIVALAALVVLSYWTGRMGVDREQEPIAGLDTRLDYALRDFEIQFYDLQGVPSARLTAPKLANQAATGIGEITQPEFNVVHRGNVWNIVAQFATVGSDRDRVLLRGDVVMRRRASFPGQPLQVNTSELLLEVNQRLASTDRYVRIEDGADTLRALGFEVNLANDHFTLLDEVELTYAVN